MIPSEETIKKLQKLRKRYLTDFVAGEDIYATKLYNMDSLLSVSMSALQYLTDNGAMKLKNERESAEIYHSTPHDVIRALEIAKKMMPYGQIEFVESVAKVLHESE